MRESQQSLTNQARRLIGTPVCIELKNGSAYIGRIESVENGQLIFAGMKRKRAGNYRRTGKAAKKARVSGLFPGFDSFMGFPFGGAGAAGGAAAQAQGQTGGGLLGGLGGLEGIMGFMNKAMPMIKMGMGVIKTIMPLFKGFGG